MSTAKERQCWVCGVSLGVIESKHYDRGDTCGANACEQEARDAERQRREEAHDKLDDDMGWR